MEQINVDLIPGKVLQVCHASQYDIGRTIRINLFEGGQVYTFDGTQAAQLKVRKTDGNVVTAALTAASGTSYVEIETTQQMTACAGLNMCDIVIIDSSNSISTANFVLSVEEDPLNGGVNSESEIHDLQEQVNACAATALSTITDLFADYAGLELVDSFNQKQYIKTNGAIGSTVNMTPSTNNSINCKVVDCEGGDLFYVTGTGFDSARLISFVDSNNVLLYHANANVVWTNERVIAPVNAAKAIINVSRSATYSAVLIKMHAPYFDSVLNSSNITINSANYQTLGITDANSLPANRIFGISSNITAAMVPNLPVYGTAGLIMNLAGTSPSASNVAGALNLQIYVSFNGYFVYYRMKASDTYTDWITGNPSTNITLTSSNYTTYGVTDVDDYPPDKVIGISANIAEEHVANLPMYGQAAFLFGVSAYQATADHPSGQAGVQFYITTNGQNYYFRTKGGGAWGKWYSVTNNDNYSLNSYFVATCVQKPIPLDNSHRVILFGDSITTGTGSDDMSDPQYWLKYVSDMTGCQWTTYGVGSSAFTDTGNPDQVGGQVITAINGNSVDWNTDVVVVAAGTNDAGFGYKLDEQTLLTQLRADVIACITAIQGHLHNAGRDDAKIIFITPLRRGGSTPAKIAIRSLLPKVASQISNAALMNGVSVINGFDFPVTVETTDYYTRMTNYDELHPNNTGKMVYARSFINAVL